MLSCAGQMASSGYDWQYRMDRETELQIILSAYAKRVMFAAGIRDRRVETAFAAVPREHFLGRGPWPILRWNRG
jgi:protein-L-isoaspartate(D-aspartate) O-methyltransferase